MKRKTGMTREVRECLAEMGVTTEVMAKVRAASNHTEGKIALDEVKDICRKGFKVAARDYHPDLNHHLSEEERLEKAERFKRLRSVHDDFLKSRYRGPRKSNTRRAATDFDPFGFHTAARQDLEDDLRYWDDPVVRNFVKRKREVERQRAAEFSTIYEDAKKRIYWEKMGLNYDEIKRKAPKEKVMTLAGHKGVWYPERGRWILQTKRPKK